MPKLSEFNVINTAGLENTIIPLIELNSETNKRNKNILISDLRTLMLNASKASAQTLGVVRVGTSLTIDNNGVLNVLTPIPSQATNNGKILTTNGTTLAWQDIAEISVPPASTTVSGIVRIDGTTITIDQNNVISANVISGFTVIAPDDTEIEDITTLVFTGTGITLSSAGNAVTLDISGGGNADTGDFTFTNSEASVPTSATMTLLAPGTNNKESKLTLNTLTTSTLYAANLLTLGVNYGTGSELYWQFLANGTLDAPGKIITPEIEGRFDGLAMYSNWEKDTGISIVSQTNLESVTLTSDRLVAIVTNFGSEQKDWVFGTNGTISFPDGTVQSTAYSGLGLGGVSRGNFGATTASLANNATGNITIPGFKSYMLMSIYVDNAAWVRIYTDTSSRLADASRLEGTDPSPSSGVIAEVVTTGPGETILISPATLGFSNESPPTTDIPVAVTNKSGVTQAIDVVLTLLQLES
jgi:hypothetical protein